MKQQLLIRRDVLQIQTIEELASVLEGIASLHIEQVKDQVIIRRQFFNELWQIYLQLRSDPGEQFNAKNKPKTKTGKTRVFVVVTAEEGFSGDMDNRIIERMLQGYNPQTTDLVVVGSHGANRLAERSVNIMQSFHLPSDASLRLTSPLTSIIRNYSEITVFYQSYISLGEQRVSAIDLVAVVQALGRGKSTNSQQPTINSRDYLFEPSVAVVIDAMEAIMLEVGLSQIILEARLSQLASRFNAMNQAKTKAHSRSQKLNLQLHRAIRQESDKSLQETIIASGFKHD